MTKNAAAEKQEITIEDAVFMAFRLWRDGKTKESLSICQEILKVRPAHQGARHLLMAVESGVTSFLVFTAIRLSDPCAFDIGDFSYGIPAVSSYKPSQDARCSIGSFCTIGHEVEMYLGDYHRADTFSIFPFSAPHFGNLFPSTQHIKDYSATKGGVSIGSDVWIGAGSKIMSGVSIADGAVIGAGAVVTKDVGPYEIWAGNPAVFKKHRFDEATSDRLLRLRWWDWPKDVIEANAREIMSSSDAALRHLEGIKQRLLAEKNRTSSVFRYSQGYSSVLRAKLPENWLADRPTWVVLHGSLGSIESTLQLAQHAKNVNLVFLDLPGCGDSMPPQQMSVAGFAAEIVPALHELIHGDYRVIGASFGGSVGLEIARQDSRCKGVVLLDTPFTALKLWHNHLFLRGLLAQRPDDRYLRRFAHTIYGVTDEAVFERDYWYLLNDLSVPITVVTGDLPMMPPCSVPPVPCCLDEADLERLVSSGVLVKRISGGHDLINDNPVAVAALLDELGI